MRTTETSWWRANEMSLGVSFETCLRRREDIPIRRRCYILLKFRHDVPIKCRKDAPLRRLGHVPSRLCLLFHLRRTCDVAGTYRNTLLWRRHDVLLSGGSPLACLLIMSKLTILVLLKWSFEFLKKTCTWPVNNKSWDHLSHSLANQAVQIQGDNCLNILKTWCFFFIYDKRKLISFLYSKIFTRIVQKKINFLKILPVP